MRENSRQGDNTIAAVTDLGYAIQSAGAIRRHGRIPDCQYQ